MVFNRTKEIFFVFLLYIILMFCFIKVSNNITNVTQQFLFEAFWHTLFCLIIFFVVKVVERSDIKTLDIYFSNIGKQFFWGIGLGLILLLPLIIKIFILHSEIPTIFNNSSEITIFSIIPYIINDFIFVGFTEELVFRGYLLNRVREISNSEHFSVIFSSIIFGLSHYPIEKDFIQVIFAIFIGLLFSYVKLSFPKSCSLFSLAFAHGLYDSGLVLIAYLSYIFR